MPRSKRAAGAAVRRGAERGTKSGTASAFSLGNAARGAEGNGEAEPSKLAPGLYLVATPIGNLADVTLRALRVLRSADAVLCEDTRVTAKLLARYGIAAATQPYHDHNAERVRPGILARLKAGAALALVSDAGTPLVSDPGFKLVRAALADGIAVTAVPGPSAALAALLASGLPPDRFLFAGFLPPKEAARRRSLDELKDVDATLVFFESAPRLAASLADMAAILGPRPAAVARELTKLHEEVRRGSLAELAAQYRASGPPKGELVVVVGPPERTATSDAEIDRALGVTLAHKSLREAVEDVASATGARRRHVYARALALKGGR
ncbi:MAG: 16S rRNA (cytidine(1402)-2'-O)-methyltransferase [Alphaproteobacteria bacterium]|nr:16S rRNA (cytidine(1402)-2'-O)-methyltransferase [Alphaproteobacteria bacterium]